MGVYYYFSRILRALITLWLVVTFVFVILRVAGDPLLALVGENAHPDEIAYYAEKWGLDQPLYVQYLNYFRNIMQGDLGRSFANDREATKVVLERVPTDGERDPDRQE